MIFLRTLALASISLLLAAGCAGPSLLPNPLHPVISSYHSKEDGVPMRRVAVLPIDFDESLQSNPTELDSVFHAELSKTNAFEVIPVSREDLNGHFGLTKVSSVQIIPRDLLYRLVQEYNVDGVLFTDVTHYFPYRPLAIGIRSKLVDAHSGVERWVFDHTFDSGNPAIAASAKQFAIDQQYQQIPITTDGSSILQSPSLFGKYVAHETYRSLLAK